MRLQIMVTMVLLTAGCGGSRATTPDGGDGTGDGAGDSGAADDGGVPDAPDAAIGCAPGVDLPAVAAKPLALYPAPRLADVAMLGARVATACVDSSALGAHARLDALVPSLLTEAGLKQAPAGCSCDYTIRFASTPPALSGAAATTWMQAGTTSERYLATTTTTGGRAVATLFSARENAALYAVRAALALVQADPSTSNAHRVASGTIVDYPSLAARGVVEGIYGPNNYCDAATMTFLPWRPGDRRALLDLMSRLRENVFIYAPKCDAYTRARWRDPYPADSSDEEVIRVAVHDADANLIDFVWAISPGGDYNFASPAADFAKLTAKIDEMRQLGVRHFALFLDDIPDHSAGPQVTLVNAVEDYLRKAAPTEHLLVVGTTYCSSPNNTFNCGGPNAYTDAMGQGVRPEVEIMWTGADVEPSTMTAGDMQAINTSLKRKTTIWDNWPNAPGSFTGRSADLPTAVQGYYSNPVLNEYPGPANPAATFHAVLGPIADWAWDAARYVGHEPASYSAWQPILKSLAVDGCTPCGNDAPGWTCSDAHTVAYCDFDTKCLSQHACPGGCQTEAAGTADRCN